MYQKLVIGEADTQGACGRVASRTKDNREKKETVTCACERVAYRTKDNREKNADARGTMRFVQTE